jgi:hypothetical protein
MGVVAGVDDDLADLGSIPVPGAEPARQVDQRLRLVLGRMLLGVGLQDRPLRLAGSGQRHRVRRLRAGQQPGDDAVLALIDGARRALAAHRPVHGLDRRLPGERGRVGLPAGDLSLAGLPGLRRAVQRLADRLVGGLGVQAEQRGDPGGGRRPQVGDVVDLVLVQADPLH